jgi:benzoyl-CoA reductase/2-hydroxyglutaryl-CoA dehydratase subunit BcrC/BadD/HgdB
LIELKLLKKEIEKFSGMKIKEKNLRQSITLLNKKRTLLRKLYSTRKADKPPISGIDSLLVVQASYYDDLNRWMERTEMLCAELEQRMKDAISVCDEKAPRIMLAGSPILMPNWKVPNVIEESKAIIVCDELCTGLRGFYDLVEVDEWNMDEMLIALAERYLMASCACFTPNKGRIDRILRLIKDFRVEGIIYFTLQACHPYGMESYAVKEALDKIGVPMLKIETDYSQEDIEQLRTRVEAFLEMVKARR